MVVDSGFGSDPRPRQSETPGRTSIGRGPEGIPVKTPQSKNGAHGAKADPSTPDARSATLRALAISAAELTADAAEGARYERVRAGHAASELVAEQAAQTAAAARYRADAAATLVSQAAEIAAQLVARSEPTSAGPAALRRAADMTATVQAAAAAVANESALLAENVSRMVEATADLVASTRIAVDRAIHAEVVATADAIEVRALATAATEKRLDRQA